MFVVVIFFQIDNAIGIIASLVIFVVAFQLSLGPICFNLPVETCLASTIGPLNGWLWINCATCAALGPILMGSIGPDGTFLFFGSYNLL